MNPDTTTEQPKLVNKKTPILVWILFACLGLSVLVAVSIVYFTPKMLTKNSSQSNDTTNDLTRDESIKESDSELEENLDSKLNTYSYKLSGLDFSFNYPKEYSNGNAPEIGWDGPELKKIINFELELPATGSSTSSFLIFLVSKTDKSLTNYVSSIDYDEDGAVKSKISKIGEYDSIEYLGFYKNELSHYVSILKEGYVYSVGLLTAESDKYNQSQTELLTDIIKTLEIK